MIRKQGQKACKTVCQHFFCHRMQEPGGIHAESKKIRLCNTKAAVRTLYLKTQEHENEMFSDRTTAVGATGTGSVENSGNTVYHLRL